MIKIEYTYKDLQGFFVGSYFGDGCFVKKSKTHNTYVCFKHCEAQKMYLEWKLNFLKNFWFVKSETIIRKVKLIGCYNNAQDQYSFISKTSEYLNRFKTMSKIDLMKDFNEMALSVYVLDDGNIENNVCKISCAQFSDEEREFFCSMLKDRFDICCYIYHCENNPVKDCFYISKEDCMELKKIILSKIPNEIDIVKNKIKGE